jgi:hypothetical protein
MQFHYYMIVLLVIQTWQKLIFKPNQDHIKEHYHKLLIYIQLSSPLQQFIILDHFIPTFIMINHQHHISHLIVFISQ